METKANNDDNGEAGGATSILVAYQPPEDNVAAPPADTTDMTAAAAAAAAGVSNETGKKERKDSEKEEEEESPVKLSKSQMKKKRRLEHKMAIKKRRKQQERETKAARAAAQGRDVEAERREQERRAREGVGKKRRDKRWAQRLAAAANKFQVCVDCAFESSLTVKEINSLALQLRYCYATNRRVDVPCLLAATSVAGQTLGHLENVSGFAEWGTRGFTVTEKPLEEYYAERKSDLVYLTSDSDNVLKNLENDKIYIIGGIVDRNRLKRAALGRAETLQISTAKLPLDEHLQKMESTRVLTCNHVFDILMHFREHRSWEQALISVLPDRKGAKLASQGSGGPEDGKRGDRKDD